MTISNSGGVGGATDPLSMMKLDGWEVPTPDESTTFSTTTTAPYHSIPSLFLQTFYRFISTIAKSSTTSPTSTSSTTCITSTLPIASITSVTSIATTNNPQQHFTFVMISDHFPLFVYRISVTLTSIFEFEFYAYRHQNGCFPSSNPGPIFATAH